jgi:hypothetical protein
MSCLFEVDETTVWNPSNTVARLFQGQTEAAAETLRIASGVGPIIEDECQIDLPVFEEYLSAVVQKFHDSTHPILKSMLTALIATSWVIVERAGGRLPKTEPAQAAAWEQLSQEFAHSMPR